MSSQDAIPPPPGFPPVSCPIASECVAVERFGFFVRQWCFAGRPCQKSGCGAAVLADCPGSGFGISPDDVLLISPLVDVRTDSVPDVIRPVAPMPPTEQIFAPNRLWAPVAVPSPAIDDRRETLVPRWRLAREGPSWRSNLPSRSVHWGLVGVFRNTSYRCLDYDTPSGEFGLPVHHPQFLEWIGVPQSACLLEIGAGRWVDHLSYDGTVAVTVQLQ